MADQALTGIKVLDLSQNISGPYCTKLFADYGAEVIKIEPPEGDPSRRAGPFLNDDPHPERSGLFMHLNTNKLGITLNLETATGADLFKELVRDADAVVESFPPGTMASLGISYEELESINPRLVMVSVTPFGQTGPYKDFVFTELTAWAMGSRMSITGQMGREPHPLGGNAAQYLAGTQAATSGMGALMGAALHGIGQHVDVSMQETLLGAVDARLLFTEYTKEVATRGDNPAAGFQFCQDGYVQFPANFVQPRQWNRVVRLLDMPELMEDPRFATPGDRGVHRDDLDAIILPWLLDRSKYQIAEAAQAEGVFAAPVLDVGEVVESEHFASRGYFVEVDHPETGPVRYGGAPFQMRETPWDIRRPPPMLGQHNVEIYCDRLGRTREDLVKYRQTGVI